MSMWDRVRSGVQAAAIIAQQTAQQAIIASQQAYEDLRSFPTEASCWHCELVNPVPPETWGWNCPVDAQHPRNPYGATECATCSAQAPSPLPPYTVVCGGCGSQFSVKTTRAAEHLRNAPKATKEFVVEHVGMAKKSIEELRASPNEFHCIHCKTLLAVPRADWTCKVADCLTRNEAGADICQGCGKRPVRNKVRCGVCQRPTPVPGSNFESMIRGGVSQTRDTTKRLYFSVAKVAHVECTRCRAPIKLPQAMIDGQQQQPAAAPQQQQQQQQPNTLDCPDCGEHLNLDVLLRQKQDQQAHQQQQAAAAAPEQKAEVSMEPAPVQGEQGESDDQEAEMADVISPAVVPEQQGEQP